MTPIRAALAADAGPLSNLMRECFVAANGHASSPENIALFLQRHYGEPQQAAEIADPDVLTLLVDTEAPGWAGYAQLRLATPLPPAVPYPRAVELGRIYLRAQWHGRGVAAELMQRLCDEARSRGADGLWACVWAEAPQAIRFYRKHEFRVVGTTPFRLGNDVKEDLVMARAL